MKKSIIFDLDGTLWDTTKQVKEVWKNVAKKYKLNVNDKQIKEIMGLTKREIIVYLFKDNVNMGNDFITECQEKENQYLSMHGGNIYDNVIETLYKLYNSNYELYIVSNCQIGYIETFIEYYKLNGIFKDYECSGNTGKDKEENIRKILKRNNIMEAVYIGDTEKDYIAAKNNNLQFIWVEYGFGKCKQANIVIKDISELSDRFNNII